MQNLSLSDKANVIDHSISSRQNKEVKRQDWTASDGAEFNSGREMGEVCARLATKTIFNEHSGFNME